MKCFRAVSTNEEGKKLGAMSLVNHICKILFFQNNVARCSHYYKVIFIFHSLSLYLSLLPFLSPPFLSFLISFPQKTNNNNRLFTHLESE